MALPSGSISSLHAGLLRVSLSAKIAWNNATYPPSGGGDLALRAWVNDGSQIQYLPIINRTAPSSSMVFSYPGGGATWTMGVEVTYYQFGSGGGFIMATNIQLAAELKKR